MAKVRSVTEKKKKDTEVTEEKKSTKKASSKPKASATKEPKADVKPISEHMDMDKEVIKPITMSDLPAKERLTEEEIDRIVKEEQDKIIMMGDAKRPSKQQLLKEKLKKTGMITTRDI